MAGSSVAALLDSLEKFFYDDQSGTADLHAHFRHHEEYLRAPLLRPPPNEADR